ncbi:MAG: hypothetical protein D3903_20755, partial [Candidatus Electrothrix sp. GM3_4]|nr:hypothetical protein [Candidatus Electrothrix sp. GM3_4]
SADGAVTLTATAFDSVGNPLGSTVLSYKPQGNKHRGAIDGLPSKPFLLEVISSGSGSDSGEGGEIGVKD